LILVGIVADVLIEVGSGKSGLIIGMGFVSDWTFGSQTY